MKLNPKLFQDDIEMVPIRKGFGEGLVNAAQADEQIMALCADLTESTQMEPFKKAFPERFVEIGVAEQNLVTIASGLSAVNKKPFVTSYAGFSPGRNWEQIRTTICLNERNVKIVGSHAGVSVGPDGATHQMLEDIVLMRSLPKMIVVVPCDSIEARKATEALAKINMAAYLRLAREATAVVTADESPFEVGKAQILQTGNDLSLIACGPLVYEALKAAKSLADSKISAEVINCATIKPIDEATIIASAKKTGKVITIEEGQNIGGLAGAVAELLAKELPTPMKTIGVNNRFGQSGKVQELWEEYGLDANNITKIALKFVK